MFGPYLEPISKEDKPEGVDSQGRGLMYVNSPFHQQLLQVSDPETVLGCYGEDL